MSTYADGFHRVLVCAGLEKRANVLTHVLSAPLRLPDHVDRAVRGMNSRSARRAMEYADTLRAQGFADRADSLEKRIQRAMSTVDVGDITLGLGVASTGALGAHAGYSALTAPPA